MSNINHTNLKKKTGVALQEVALAKEKIQVINAERPPEYHRY